MSNNWIEEGLEKHGGWVFDDWQKRMVAQIIADVDAAPSGSNAHEVEDAFRVAEKIFLDRFSAVGSSEDDNAPVARRIAGSPIPSDFESQEHKDRKVR